ncbi:LicD family protein [Lactococcus cremoris]|nr:LicD family protein [Lactococcus cremoris]WKD56548.1 LicD family protein [Lactococcus cremoris]
MDYFLVGGSLLGAVRHNGMIPWDDDIDVGMTGENYDKFIQVMNNSQNEKYSLMSSESEESYTTQIVLDILAFDNLADNERRAKIQGIKSFIYGKLSYLTTIENPTVHQVGIKLFFINTTIKSLSKNIQTF